MDEDTKLVICGALGMIAGLGLGAYLHFSDPRVIPSKSKVQDGFVAPSKIEILCGDLDKNGEPETLMKIGTKHYLLREVSGKPVISTYEVKPAEIVPK
jgi:hypothetical protein